LVTRCGATAGRVFEDWQTLQDPPTSNWLTPLRSAGVLLMGKTTQGVLSIAYMALAARALGVADFGILIILNGLVVAVSEVARFDSWQVVLRYGTKPFEASDQARLHEVLKFTLLLDAIGALIGIAVVLAGLAAAMHVFAVPAELQWPARIFSLSVFFLISTGGANGVLRLVDRFDLIAWQTTIAPVIRLAGTLLLFIAGADLEAFLWLWLGATAAGRSVLHVLAWYQLHRRGLLGGFGTNLRTPLASDGAVWRFAFGTSANATLAVVDKHAGMLGVGWLIGPAASGFYRVALNLADLLIKPSRAFLIPAIYPELARLTARDHVEARERMVWRTLLVASGASIAVLAILILFGESIIALVFGPGFGEAYGVMVFLALAGAINICIFPLEPLLVSVGRVRATVVARLISVSIYLVLLYSLVLQIGLTGAGIASCVYAAIRAVMLAWLARTHLRTAMNRQTQTAQSGDPKGSV
jgi:O-antigen/teichoic acid export membrane protein